MGENLFWKHAHRFVGWMIPAGFMGYLTILGTLAAIAQTGNSQSKIWLDGQIAMIGSALSMPYLFFYVFGLTTLWLAAFCYSSYRIELAALRNAPASKEDVDNAVAAARAAARFFPLKTKLGE